MALPILTSYGQPQPSLTPYLLENGEAGRGCVIVCPGGAYMDRAECESGCIAQMYRDAGFNAFVLGYRIARISTPLSCSTSPAPCARAL